MNGKLCLGTVGSPCLLQRERKSGTNALSAAYVDGLLMRLNDVLYNGQAKPRPTRFT
jgi:hypothetical protein